MRRTEICERSISEWSHLIDEWVYSERDRYILKRHLLDGLTYEQLAEDTGLSTRQIARVVPKAKEILFRKIK